MRDRLPLLGVLLSMRPIEFVFWMATSFAAGAAAVALYRGVI